MIFSLLSVNNYNPNQNYLAAQNSWQSNNFNAFPPNFTNNYYPNSFAPNVNPQVPPNAGYNPYLQQQASGPIGSAVGVGVLVSHLESKNCRLILDTLSCVFSVRQSTMLLFFNHVR